MLRKIRLGIYLIDIQTQDGFLKVCGKSKFKKMKTCGTKETRVKGSL